MSEPENAPDMNAATVLALIQAENDYRSAMVGPVSPAALPLLRTGQPADTAAGEALLPAPDGEADR